MKNGVQSKWPTRKLAECGEWVSGGTPSKSVEGYWNGEIPWISSKSLKSFDLHDSEDRITQAAVDDGTSLVPTGTVMFVVRGMSLANEFRVGVTTRPVAFNQDLRAIIPADGIDGRFLTHYLKARQQAIIGLANNASHGTKRLPTEMIEGISVPIPPLPEQRRIAAILDKADAIRRKREEGIRLTEELLRSTFLEMFGDPVKNQKGWEAASIGSLCRLVRGSSPRPKGDPRYYNGPVKRLMVEDLTRDGLEVLAKIDSLTEEGAKLSRPVPSGTIVLVVSGNVGLPAKLMEDACIHDGFVGLLDLDTSKVRPDYLLHTLLLIRVLHERNKAGAIWQNLTTDQVKATKVPLPSLNDQDRFLAVVTQHRKLAAARKQQVEQIEQLFCSLVQRAFRGEL